MHSLSNSRCAAHQSTGSAQADVDIELENDLEALLTGDFQTRWEAAKRLPALGDRALAALLALLEDPDLDWEVHWFAARVLGAFDRPEAVAALLSRFTTAEDEELRHSIAEALTQIGPRAVQALTALLSDPLHRPTAAQALSQIRHPSTLAPLLQLAQDEAASVRQLAIAALAGYHDPQILPVVQAALTDSSSEVRLEAVKALIDHRSQFSEAALLEQIQPCLGDCDEAVAVAAIAALGRLSSEAAVAQLVQLLQQPDLAVARRQSAIAALGWMNCPGACTALIQTWSPTADHSSMIQALVNQRQPLLRQRAAAALLGWLEELSLSPTAATAPLRQQLALALGHLGYAAAAPVLTALSHDRDMGVQLHAIAALRQLALEPSA